MNNIKDQENLSQKKVLLRLDLNVPLKNGLITDETRINKIIPVINFLVEKKSKIIIISHVGRPKGEVNKTLSLKPICENLQKKIKKKIKLFSNNIFEIKQKDLFKNPDDQIVLLENIRFYKEEEKNDTSLAKHLASFADFYVNDAFSCSHRSHTSVSKIAEFLPAFAGLQFETEINALKKVTTEIKKPITCIIGGSKISTKIKVIKNLIPKFDNIIIVGGMANNIISYKGNQIGKSLKEENCEAIIKEIFEISKNYSCTITYPEDVLVGKNMDDKSQIKEIDNIKNDDLILDIGPKTINKIKNTIFLNQNANEAINNELFNKKKELDRKIQWYTHYTQQDKVHIIAHSMGGIVSMLSHQKHQSPIASLTTLGTPWKGTKMHMLGLGKHVRQLAPGHPIIQKMSLPPFPHLAITADLDWILLPSENAILKNMQNTQIKNINLIRPLIKFNKKDLIFLSKFIFNFNVDDPTNHNIKFNRIKVRNLIKKLEDFGLDKKKFQLTIENLKKSDQSIKFYVEKNKRENSNFNYRKNELILKENFFDNSHEVIFRSLSDLIHLVGKKPNFVRGKKIENILSKIKVQKLRKETLGGCVIKMVNHTVILTKEE